ncbi:MAG TPA: outer membrane lipoprotein chaperone LolA [Burkholderiales bacterium]|nr:outer membrane lipoprotein chaperone LolA [Burkholderiales bacterium]
MNRKIAAWIGSALVLAASPVQAGGVERLKAFVSETRSGQAQFDQTVLDRAERKVQSASGSFQFQRPGRFRWAYEKPAEQLIVGDGKRFWVYDKDLNQVTVKKLDLALGATPAALLAGSDDIEAAFRLEDGGAKDGLEWVEALPRNRDSGFERVRMGFNAQALPVAMELKDQFGQTTYLKFSKMEKNPKLGADLFTFAPPKGADVISD